MNTFRVMAEDWLPMAELGIESRRERAAASALPPLSFLHVWWARRPLVASAGVVLAGLLPAWTPELATAFPNNHQVSTEAKYRDWLKYLTGIWGDPIKARKAYDLAVASGVRIPNPYTYKQAFRNHIDSFNIRLLDDVLTRTWGERPLLADVTAGGGSIPFAAAKLGIRTYANDLNGVAAAVLRSGVEYPAEFGTSLAADLEKWGKELTDRVRQRLAPLFPSGPGEQVATYIWAHTVACPRTDKSVPLVPDWTLRAEHGKEAAVRLVVQRNGKYLPEAEFDIVHGQDVDFDPKHGTVKRGDGLSPWDHMVIDGEYIRSEAKAGRLGAVLYAVVFKHADGTRGFRAPTALDRHALQQVGLVVTQARSAWAASGIIPSEAFPPGNDLRPLHYGMEQWTDFFTQRQLLVHAAFTDEYVRMIAEVQAAMDAQRAKAVLTLLGLMQGKALNYNCKLTSWHAPRQVMRSVFERHDFSFKWTFAEFEGTALYAWALSQLLDAYKGLANLMALTGSDLTDASPLQRAVEVSQGNAANLPALGDGTVAHLCMDPPYYDNVMYAELSDFFYVWEKRTIGRIAPELFEGELADKENEAVANNARFAHMGKRMRPLADADYEAKMTAIFTEARRVLRDDGVLTVMFTHKRADAWDTLGMGLMKAGFTIESSWPVNTEAEHSLHQSGVNSAASTIMLVCRKRAATADAVGNDVYLEDIEGEVRHAARSAVDRFRADGIDGVDLLLSAYGPTLSVVSKHWPVHSSEADAEGRSRLLRPEEALAVARAEIVRVQRARLVGHPIEFDPLTDFVVAFWDVIKDGTATFDEGRRLALAVGGLDVDELQRAKVLDKKAGTVRLLAPKERLRPRGNDDQSPGVRPQADSFGSLIDAVHTVCLVADEDGLGSAKALLDRTGLSKDTRFLAAVQALVNAVPRVRAKGVFVLPLAGSLDRVVTAYLPDVTLPPDPVEELAEQGALFLGALG